MKTIQIGRMFEIYDDSLQAHERLPAGIYTIRFSRMHGFVPTYLTVTRSRKRDIHYMA